MKEKILEDGRTRSKRRRVTERESHSFLWCLMWVVFRWNKSFRWNKKSLLFSFCVYKKEKVSATRMTDLRRQRVPRNQSCTLGHTFRTHFQDTVFLSSVSGRNEETKDLSHRERDKKRHPRHLSCLFSFLLFHFFWIWLVFSFLSTSWYLIRLLPSSCL